MTPDIERAEAALIEAIEARERELANLKQALVIVRSNATAPNAITPVSSEFAGLGITAGARRLLDDGGELTTRQIAERLLAGGIRTRSKNFIATVHATLRNASKQFQSRHQGRELAWSLRKVETPNGT